MRIRVWPWMVGLLLAQPAQAQGGEKEKPAAASSVSVADADLEFARAAWQAGVTNIRLGELAGSVAENAEVQRFARLVVLDDSRLREDLELILKDLGIVPADVLDAPHQALVRRLSRLTGTAFEREYLQVMVQVQAQSLGRFAMQSKDGRDERLRSYADQYQPVIEQHLHRAAALRMAYLPLRK